MEKTQIWKKVKGEAMDTNAGRRKPEPVPVAWKLA